MGSKKRSRPAKSSKVKSISKISSIIDPLTGSVVNSDVVYGPGSSLLIGFPPPRGSMSLELEFSSDKIVATQVDTYKLDSPYLTNPDTIYTAFRRIVLQGDFTKTKEGKLTGTLRSITSGSASSSSYSTDIQDGITHSIEHREMGPNTRLWSHLTPGPGSVVVYEYASQLSPYSSSSVETNKGRLGELGVASFYADGWWTDPFSSNLIG
jgi:hypothetical protein